MYLSSGVFNSAGDIGGCLFIHIRGGYRGAGKEQAGHSIRQRMGRLLGEVAAHLVRHGHARETDIVHSPPCPQFYHILLHVERAPG